MSNIEILKVPKDGSENDQRTDTGFEAEQNLLGVFEILLAVDKRINPDKYKIKKS